MKSTEVFSVLEALIKKAKPQDEELRLVAHLANTIKSWEMVMRFYAKGNYDAGVTARKFLEEQEPGDEATFRELDKSARKISRYEYESES